MKKTSQQKIKVAILDDHLSALDSYQFRLGSNPNIEVVATASYADELEAMLAENPVNVLILDVGVPNSAQNRNPYPILYVIPRLREEYPQLHILIISMYEQPTFVRFLLEAGANGYILKDDQDAIVRLPEIVTSVSTGGLYLSGRLNHLLSPANDENRMLSPRQQEALSLITAYPELDTDALASKMNVAPSTARNLLSRAYKRLGVHSRVAAAQRARDLGLQIIFPEEVDK